MKRALKHAPLRILKVMLGTLIALLIAVHTLLNLPPVQRWMGRTVADAVGKELGIRAEVGSARLGFGPRLVLQDVALYDRSDSLMIHAERVAAKIQLSPLIHKRIRIVSAQLIDADIRLYKACADSALNISFLFDSSGPDPRSQSSTDLQIKKLVLSRCNVRYDLLDAPYSTDRFDVNHLAANDISLSAALKAYTEDSLNVRINHLRAKEASGLELKNLSLQLEATAQHALLNGLHIELNNSQLDIPQLQATYNGMPGDTELQEWLKELACQSILSAHIAPADFKGFVPALQSVDASIDIATRLLAQDGILRLQDLQLYEAEKHIELQADASYTLGASSPQWDADIHALNTSGELHNFLSHNLQRNIPQLVERLGETHSQGTIACQDKVWNANLSTTTERGRVTIEAVSDGLRHFEGSLTGSRLMLDLLLDNSDIPTQLTLHSNFDATLPASGKLPEGFVNVHIDTMMVKGVKVVGTELDLLCHNQTPHLTCTVSHPDADLDVNGSFAQRNGTSHLQAELDVRNFLPETFGLPQRVEGESLSLSARSELTFTDIDHVRGYVELNDITLKSDSLGTNNIGYVNLQSSYDETGRKNIIIKSKPIDASIVGNFHWQTVANSVQQVAHHYMPSLLPAQNLRAGNDELALHAYIEDTLLIQRLTGLQLSLPERSIVDLHVKAQDNFIDATGYFPTLIYGSNTLSGLGLNVRTNDGVLHTAISGGLRQKASTLSFNTSLRTNEQSTRAVLDWDNNGAPSLRGQLNINGRPYRDEEGEQAFLVEIDTSQVVIGDTVWQVSPARIDYRGGRTYIDGLGASTGSRQLHISGIASSLPTDTLTATLDRVELGYLFKLIKVKSIHFSGETSGRVYATSLMGTPKADAYLHVDDFAFNDGPLGNSDIYGSYGTYGKGFFLESHIVDPELGNESIVNGTIIPGKGEGTGLNLNVNANHLNIAFLNSFLKNIMQDLSGRVSGQARIFGPFSNVDLEGDLLLNEAQLTVKPLGATFNLHNDSVHMRPGIIDFTGIHVYDMLGMPGVSEHSATFNGMLRHRNFGKINYDFQVKADNLLGYNRPTLGDDSFCGIAYATGDVRLRGKNGRTDIDMRLTPMSGTIFTYNAAQPDQMTEANFIRYKKPDVVKTTNAEEESESHESDVYLNFDLDITPEATLKVLMDLRSGDNITLHGDGHLRATYFNKGRFSLYGTYNVEDGMYDMSIQDFLHKEFKFTSGSSIVFGGSPIDAALNLRAAYTVPNVSLDDLSTTALGLSNTRVDCIMNIGGHPDAPRVTFDFELPNASEEEKQMVRSMLSTEEERNMQVVYLLGIGRFYSFNGVNNSSASQSEMAMNSLVSSTLSSQFNRVLSNAIGSSNWNFGTNLRTGQMGWNNVDVEGMLSGRLLNNRLLVNGNFGYRERIYNTSNFIGDFDVQYLLTPTGSVALKAYNKSNDRYFIQSSLLTQGIGIQLKKDFHGVKDFFTRNKNKRKKKASK